jgi:hypothetical protein
MLTQAELQSKLHYEPQTGIFTWLIKPSSKVNIGDIAGGICHKYLTIRINKKYYGAHRLAWFYVHGYFPKYVDHINCNSLDNRLCNLRECTAQQNSCNTNLRSNNKSGVKGVCWNLEMKKWNVYITIDKIKKNLGYFNDLELATLVAQEARNKYHKEFANHGEIK